MLPDELSKRLLSSLEVRNTLLKCHTVEEVIQKGLSFAIDKLHSQTASIFLFSKSGYLERFSIQGIDKYGSLIDNTWFIDEKYLPGESFTGKVLVPNDNSNYGTPQWSNYLDNYKIDAKSKNAYLEKLGAINCAIAVPLNGEHRTYGVLEVINKIDKDGKAIPNLAFSQDDIDWLLSVGMSMATSISNIRARYKFQVLSDISQKLVEPFTPDPKPASTYQYIAERLINPLLVYTACIIRIADMADNLEVVAMAGININWGHMKRDRPIPTGSGLVGKVYGTGKIEIITRIEDRKDEFKNYNWIHLNALKSYVCIPLSINEEPIGTLSLFTQFVCQFDKSEIEFLKNIASSIASLAEGFRVIDELNITHKDYVKLHEDYMQIARKVGIVRSELEVSHTYKNELNNFLGALIKIKNSGVAQRNRIIETQINWIKTRVQKIEEDFKQEIGSFGAVNINDVIRDVIRYFLSEKINIKIIPELSELPYIEASEAEIQELIMNIVSNAVKAIQAANQKDGIIIITTNISEPDPIEYIEIMIKDNGIGIKNKDKGKIFRRGVSTYLGGTGMGLFFVKDIVSNYGGKIHFESTVGKGTSFYVKLPLRRLMIEGEEE